MSYLTESDTIRNAIDHFCHFPILWLDTEVADYDSKTPRLSLIQILADSTDLTGDNFGCSRSTRILLTILSLKSCWLTG
ncbi:MAG UNVERIFIED_CONTAM: hypothetical protein LVR29_27875 [Microcystis novacekii LVE1205-3]|jgi:ribonuclease D